MCPRANIKNILCMVLQVILHLCLLHKRFRQQIIRTGKIKRTKASINKIKKIVKITKRKVGKEISGFWLRNI